jgi:hypothetical protein
VSQFGINDVSLVLMMKHSKKIEIPFLLIILLSFASLLLISCGSPKPSTNAAAMEETVGGEEVFEQEFSECVATGAEVPENPMIYPQYKVNSSSPSNQQERSIESQFPHLYSSLNHIFPERGSWRKTKAEIMDLVDRNIWSPEKNRNIKLIEYFDMVLLINASVRNNDTPSNHSAQRMQILVRNGTSNNINDWKRIHTWPISTGLPCGKKIETPTGVYKFNPSRTYSNYYSKLFDNVQMFQTMFLYHDYQTGKQTGVAIHGTEIVEKLGRRGSGGCVRVNKPDMKCFFDTVTGNRSTPCLATSKLNFYGKVPSLLPRNGEADPQFLSSDGLEVDGFKVMIAIFDDSHDVL